MLTPQFDNGIIVWLHAEKNVYDEFWAIPRALDKRFMEHSIKTNYNENIQYLLNSYHIYSHKYQGIGETIHLYH